MTTSVRLHKHLFYKIAYIVYQSEIEIAIVFTKNYMLFPKNQSSFHALPLTPPWNFCKVEKMSISKNRILSYYNIETGETMQSNQNSNYNNESITSLKGADRVRLRPGVIFGSDGLEGCEHAVFEILSNSIDEAREGFGSKIEVVRYKDQSILVKDYGRGIPVDYNPKEERFNWELVFCELY